MLFFDNLMFFPPLYFDYCNYFIIFAEKKQAIDIHYFLIAETLNSDTIDLKGSVSSTSHY